MIISVIREHIAQRAEATPRLVAVRFDGSPVTFGELDETISSYEVVMARNAVSTRSAFFASLMHLIPALGTIDNHLELQRVLNEIVAWLAREVDVTATPTPRLRAVG